MAEKQGNNIFDYMRTAQETFAQRPAGPVDSLVLSQLSYIGFEAAAAAAELDPADPGLTVRDYFRTEWFGALFHAGITEEKDMEILALAAASPRFRDLRVRNIRTIRDEAAEEVFCAMAFSLGEDLDYVAFRGTVSSLLGWKEDFNMAFLDVIPSQTDAAVYLDDFYGAGTGGRMKRLLVGGHSKGGNLAVYSALKCSPEVRARIDCVYSHDGPGFRDDVLAQLSEVRKLEPVTIRKTVPQTSIIGMLLENHEDYQVVKSDGVLIEQHEAYTWQIEGNDFVYLDDLSQGGAFFDRTMHDWVSAASDGERELFVNTLYEVLTENGIETLHDLNGLPPLKQIAILGSVSKLEPAIRDTFLKLWGSLGSYALKNLSGKRREEPAGEERTLTVRPAGHSREPRPEKEKEAKAERKAKTEKGTKPKKLAKPEPDAKPEDAAAGAKKAPRRLRLPALGRAVPKLKKKQ